MTIDIIIESYIISPIVNKYFGIIHIRQLETTIQTMSPHETNLTDITVAVEDLPAFSQLASPKQKSQTEFIIKKTTDPFRFGNCYAGPLGSVCF